MARPSLGMLALIAAVLLCHTAHALPRSAPSPLVPSLQPSVRSMRLGGMDSSFQQDGAVREVPSRTVTPAQGDLSSALRLRRASALRLRGGGVPRGTTPFAAVNKLTLGQQNLLGVLATCFFVFSEVEVIGLVSRKKLLPSVLARKLTHILTGSSMFTCCVLLPIGKAWPGLMGISAVLCFFVMAFSVAGTMPDSALEQLPPLLEARVRNLSATACRRGTREELVRGTVYYCAVLALIIPLFGTAPVSVLTVACLVLGDGLADPIGRWLAPAEGRQFRVLPFFGAKSIPGCVGFFGASLAGAWAWSRLFFWAGHFDHLEGFTLGAFDRAALIVTAIATIAEAVSPPEMDNLLIPLSTLLSCHFLHASRRFPFLFPSSPP